jgi:hypothetical protein
VKRKGAMSAGPIHLNLIKEVQVMEATAALRKLRATPIEMHREEPEEHEDAYPDGCWVYAVTHLVFPPDVLYHGEKLEDDIWCRLLSPGEQVGGRAGGDEESAFEVEALVLTRMLSFLGIPIIAEEAA